MSNRSSNDDPADLSFIASPVFKLLIASSLLARPFTDHIGPERDLTLPEWRALVSLHAGGGLSNTEVSDATGLDTMSISRALDRLNRNGRIERLRDPDDGRRLINRMTSAGRATYRAVVKLAWQRQQDMLDGLSGKDVQNLERTLDHIIDHLKHLRGEGAS